MKNIIFLILICVSLGYSQIITDTKTFNKVYVKAPAKSKQITCKIRVDLSEGLIDNYACDVNGIEVYNKNDFWIGSLGEVKAFHSQRYKDYDLDRYEGKGKRIFVNYDIPTENASWDNAEYVTCPNNHIKTIDGDYFTCVKKAICKSNEKYEYSENVCLQPDSGYMWLNNDKTDYTQRPICLNHERYNQQNNSCETKPENSHWDSETDSDWSCDEGYIERYNFCILKANCNEKQKYNEIYNNCIEPPEHGYYNSGILYCENGYVLIDNQCEMKLDCDHYNRENNTCFTKPENSHWLNNVGQEWECDAGYHRGYERCYTCEDGSQYNENEGGCVYKPENAKWIGDGYWVCKEGYFKNESNECEKIKDCGIFENYDASNNECVEKIDLTNYIKFDHDVTFGIGVANAKDIRNESTPIWNIDTYYNAGIKIGNEFFSVRGQFGVGLIYTEFEYSGETYTYMDENLNSLAFTFGPNVGFDFWLFTIDYAYIWASRNNIESIDFNTNFSKYKIGFNITEHVNINVTMITNLIESTKRLNEFDENMFMVGLTYRF